MSAVDSGRLIEVPDRSRASVVAADRDYLYYVAPSGFRVGKVPLAGGAAIPLVARGQADLHDIVPGSTSVYVCDGVVGLGGVYEVDSTTGAVTTLASDRDGPTRLALDEQNVYWVEGSPDRNGSRVVKVPRSGGPPQVVAQGSWRGTWAIASDDEKVYFGAYEGSPPDRDLRGSIKFVAK